MAGETISQKPNTNQTRQYETQSGSFVKNSDETVAGETISQKPNTDEPLYDPLTLNTWSDKKETPFQLARSEETPYQLARSEETYDFTDIQGDFTDIINGYVMKNPRKFNEINLKSLIDEYEIKPEIVTELQQGKPLVVHFYTKGKDTRAVFKNHRGDYFEGTYDMILGDNFEQLLGDFTDRGIPLDEKQLTEINQKFEEINKKIDELNKKASKISDGEFGGGNIDENLSNLAKDKDGKFIIYDNTPITIKGFAKNANEKIDEIIKLRNMIEEQTIDLEALFNKDKYLESLDRIYDLAASQKDSTYDYASPRYYLAASKKNPTYTQAIASKKINTSQSLPAESHYDPLTLNTWSDKEETLYDLASPRYDRASQKDSTYDVASPGPPNKPQSPYHLASPEGPTYDPTYDVASPGPPNKQQSPYHLASPEGPTYDPTYDVASTGPPNKPQPPEGTYTPMKTPEGEPTYTQATAQEGPTYTQAIASKKINTSQSLPAESHYDPLTLNTWSDKEETLYDLASPRYDRAASQKDSTYDVASPGPPNKPQSPYHLASPEGPTYDPTYDVASPGPPNKPQSPYHLASPEGPTYDPTYDVASPGPPNKQQSPYHLASPEGPTYDPTYDVASTGPPNKPQPPEGTYTPMKTPEGEPTYTQATAQKDSTYTQATAQEGPTYTQATAQEETPYDLTSREGPTYDVASPEGPTYAQLMMSHHQKAQLMTQLMMSHHQKAQLMTQLMMSHHQKAQLMTQLMMSHHQDRPINHNHHIISHHQKAQLMTQLMMSHHQDRPINHNHHIISHHQKAQLMTPHTHQ